MEIKRDAYLQQLIERKDNGMIKVITGIRLGHPAHADAPLDLNSPGNPLHPGLNQQAAGRMLYFEPEHIKKSNYVPSIVFGTLKISNHFFHSYIFAMYKNEALWI